MGLCVDLDKEHGLEIRRESVWLHETTRPREQQTIFGADFHVEIEKTTLLKMVKFLDNLDNRKRVFGDYLEKYDALIPNAETLKP